MNSSLVMGVLNMPHVPGPHTSQSRTETHREGYDECYLKLPAKEHCLNTTDSQQRVPGFHTAQSIDMGMIQVRRKHDNGTLKQRPLVGPRQPTYHPIGL